MQTYALTNAFSINMLTRRGLIQFEPTTLDTVRAIAQNGRIGTNAIGHADTDAIVRNLIAVDVPPAERQTLDLDDYAGLIVAQYRGPRLEAGAAELPQDATIEWWLVSRKR